ncbi:hypothetical protein [Lewinella sp. IMCC34191]|uniref:hypothetical protein n=1 Tax=Lewinella sp. IMCC34191 TaxID=2259172 RepID=UPI000E265DA9|nr:hypothetical protein [Lewinella sp. IMCC34191]
MLKYAALYTPLIVLLLAACGSEETGQATPIDGEQTVEVDAAEAGYAERPGTDSLDAQNSLALEPGLYVIEGSDCQDPTNTGWRVWTGTGLQGEGTTDCRFEMTGLEGDVYTGTQSCANGSGAEISIEILEPGSLVLTEAGETVHLTLCPEGSIPEWVEEKLSARSE